MIAASKTPALDIVISERTPPRSPAPNPDTGFSTCTINEVREYWESLGVDLGSAVWALENRKTGAVDCVVGPCGFGEFLDTWIVLDDGEQPIGQQKVSWRW